jgi:outer membrane protein
MWCAGKPLEFSLGLFLIFIFCGSAATASYADEKQPLTLSLPKAIALSLRSNRSIQGAYLDRVSEKFDLRVAKDKFYPDINLSIGAEAAGKRTSTSGIKESSSDVEGTARLEVIQQLITGAQLSLALDRSDRRQLDEDTGTVDLDRSASYSWSATVTQPLLKGAGVDVNTASIVLAELTESSNILFLKDTVSSVVNQVTSNFRAYGRSIRRRDIIASSLASSKKSLEVNRLLVDMGRIAASEIIQTEAQIANQELDLEIAMDDVDNARINLLKILDLDEHTRLIPLEEPQPEAVQLDFADCLQRAFANRSDYLNGEMAVRRARINLLLAEDNKKWSLDLVAQYRIDGSDSGNAPDTERQSWYAGVNLNVPLYGDLSREQRVVSAKTGLSQAKLALEEIRQNIRLEVKRAVRAVETQLKQVSLAVRARELAAEKLEREKEKLALGRTTNFQLVTYQNDLIRQQNQELDAHIAYLNSLSSLDTVLGTTLETWQIYYSDESDKWQKRK